MVFLEDEKQSIFLDPSFCENHLQFSWSCRQHGSLQSRSQRAELGLIPRIRTFSRFLSLSFSFARPALTKVFNLPSLFLHLINK